MPCICDEPGSDRFIAAVFQECVKGPEEYMAFIFGWVSIAFWIIAIYPEIRLNFCNKEAEALSLSFMMQWLCGDIFNTISTILLRMLFTQQFLAVFYVVTDAIIIYQMWIYRNRKGRGAFNPAIRPPELVIYLLLACTVISTMIAYGIPTAQLLQEAPQLFQSCGSGAELTKAGDIAGTVFAYLTIPLYGLGRPFEIYKNIKRGSVQGLSIGLFLCTLAGNLTQFVSLVSAIAAGIKSGKEEAPFIVSCLWPAVCDIIILAEFYYYNKRSLQVQSISKDIEKIAV